MPYELKPDPMNLSTGDVDNVLVDENNQIRFEFVEAEGEFYIGMHTDTKELCQISKSERNGACMKWSVL